MSSEVFAAVMALVGTIIGSAGGVLTAARLTNYRLSQLEEKVKIHNSLVERVTILEQQIQNREKE